MTYRKSFIEVLNFKLPESPPITEYLFFWPETERNWSQYTGGEPIISHLGLPHSVPVPIDFNFVPAFDETVHEETDEHMVVTDVFGTRKRIIKNSSAMPEYLEFPIKTRGDFIALKERLNPLSPERYPKNWHEVAENLKKSEYPVYAGSRGPFAFLRDFIRFEDLMAMFCDEGEFIGEMTDFHAEFSCRLWDKMLDSFVPDYATFGEDMAYKGASMVSPAMVRKFILPAWKKINSHLRRRGIRHIFVDSDGNTEELLPLFAEGGFDGTYPVERAAGMDPEKIREKHPRFVIIGGIDKIAASSGREAIDAEIEKAARLYAKGGYIPSFDHSVPPTVSYEDYRYYLDELKKALLNVTR
jgi:uroporphyrinogen decarboxylase